jgi:hypothetical protein
MAALNKAGGHMEVLRKMERARAIEPSAARARERAAAAAAGPTAGRCIFCLEDSPPPIQSGCGCRGDFGWAHVECRVKVGEAADLRRPPDYPPWTQCGR